MDRGLSPEHRGLSDRGLSPGDRVVYICHHLPTNSTTHYIVALSGSIEPLAKVSESFQ